MTPDRWQHIQALFEEAAGLEAGARDAFLASITDGEARDEVASLLRHAEGEGMLDELSNMLVEPLRSTLQRDAYEGRRIGNYRVLRKLGEGGMGVVYLGERADGQFEQRVALKLVRSGLGTGSLRERFLNERRILARLEHPNIARLLDGGFTEDGTPYYAMEYVEGEPIDAYCASRGLSVRKRVALFAAVADAVQHAHQKLIVHRDLKPSNVYVTADGSVKLLDFGIAKAFDAEGQSGPEASTRWLGRVMTPEYASPEQVRGEAVGTATDIYSLGVILYELLARRRPYAIQAPASPSEVERIVCATDPPRPSTAVTKDGPARAQDAGVKALRRALSGDLDTIVMKALEKEPERRYGTAGALAADLRRYLKGKPVEARPATLSYRAVKFVRRHRLGVAAMTLFLCSVIAGGLGMYWQSRRVLAERDKVLAERDKTEQVVAMMQRIFRLPDPGEALGDTITARRLLDEGVERIREDLRDQPELQATMLGEVGQVYSNLGLLAAAAPLVEEAVAIERRLHPEPHPDLARSLYQLATIRGEASAYAEADTLLREALAIREATLDPEDLDLAATRFQLADLMSSLGRYDAAEPLFRLSLDVQQRHLDAAHPAVRETMDAYATMLHRKGDFATAEALFREAVDYSRRTTGEKHPATLGYLQDLGRMVHRFQMDYPAAERLYLEALAIARSLYGDQHVETAVALNDLAQLSRDSGNLEAAERYGRESLAIWQATVGDEHNETAVSKFTLASILGQEKKHAEAETLLVEALATERRLLGDTHIRVVNTMQQLAWVYVDTRQYPRAESLFVASEQISRSLFGETHAYIVRALQGRATLRCLTGKGAEGVDLYRRALAMRLALHDASHWRVAQARSALAGCLIDIGQFEEAEQLLQASLPVLVERLGEADLDTRATRDRIERLYQARAASTRRQ
ncbi:MAG: serine/threonine-protein kinase [Rhodothermales bacterium]